jgi:hypothetical protein
VCRPASVAIGTPASIAATIASGWPGPTSATREVIHPAVPGAFTTHWTSVKPSSRRKSFASQSGASQAKGLAIRMVVVSGGGSEALDDVAREAGR